MQGVSPHSKITPPLRDVEAGSPDPIKERMLEIWRDEVMGDREEKKVSSTVVQGRGRWRANSRRARREQYWGQQGKLRPFMPGVSEGKGGEGAGVQSPPAPSSQKAHPHLHPLLVEHEYIHRPPRPPPVSLLLGHSAWAL